MRYKMKLRNKMLSSLSTLKLVLIMVTITTTITATLVTNTAIANDRFNNYEGQREWYSSSVTPAVKVYIKGSFIYALVNNRKINLPPIKLKQVSGNLLNEYATDYIRIEDFTHDRFSDIGVLKSVGYGGSNRCYAIFEYSPKFYSYKSKSRKTVCID